jgi:hypothetical protein
MWVTGALVLFGVGLAVGGCALCGTTRTTVAQVEHQLDQALPVGSARGEVEAWLKDKGIESRYTEHPDARFSSVLNEAVSDLGAYKGVTCALLRDTDRSFLVTGSIQLYFLFGPDDRLAKRIVKWIGTGP